MEIIVMQTNYFVVGGESSWATNNNSVPSPEDWGPGDAPHSGDIGARSNSTPQKPSWKDLMLVTCVYK